MLTDNIELTVQLYKLRAEIRNRRARDLEDLESRFSKYPSQKQYEQDVTLVRESYDKASSLITFGGDKIVSSTDVVMAKLAVRAIRNAAVRLQFIHSVMAEAERWRTLWTTPVRTPWTDKFAIAINDLLENQHSLNSPAGTYKKMLETIFSRLGKTLREVTEYEDNYLFVSGLHRTMQDIKPFSRLADSVNEASKFITPAFLVVVIGLTIWQVTEAPTVVAKLGAIASAVTSAAAGHFGMVIGAEIGFGMSVEAGLFAAAILGGVVIGTVAALTVDGLFSLLESIIYGRIPDILKDTTFWKNIEISVSMTTSMKTPITTSLVTSMK